MRPTHQAVQVVVQIVYALGRKEASELIAHEALTLDPAAKLSVADLFTKISQ